MQGGERRQLTDRRHRRRRVGRNHLALPRADEVRVGSPRPRPGRAGPQRAPTARRRGRQRRGPGRRRPSVQAAGGTPPWIPPGRRGRRRSALTRSARSTARSRSRWSGSPAPRASGSVEARRARAPSPPSADRAAPAAVRAAIVLEAAADVVQPVVQAQAGERGGKRVEQAGSPSAASASPTVEVDPRQVGHRGADVAGRPAGPRPQRAGGRAAQAAAPSDGGPLEDVAGGDGLRDEVCDGPLRRHGGGETPLDGCSMSARAYRPSTTASGSVEWASRGSRSSSRWTAPSAGPKRPSRSRPSSTCAAITVSSRGGVTGAEDGEADDGTCRFDGGDGDGGDDGDSCCGEAGGWGARLTGSASRGAPGSSQGAVSGSYDPLSVHPRTREQ